MLTVTPGLSATLKKLTAQLVVFHLWRERNNRLHQGPHDSTSTLLVRSTGPSETSSWLAYPVSVAKDC
ncbi:unnamed protein product, partial [Brassica oleracea]